MTASRRDFLKKSTAASIGLGLASWSTLPGRARAVMANDRISVGVIGCNGMGFADLTSMMRVPEAQCVALCDVDQSVLDRRAPQVEESWGTRPRTYGDYRQLLDDDEVDVVIIGTPDHWHCLQAIDACEAGKDVYVEKPLANSIEECRLMVKAADRYQRVVQVGQWQRSGQHWTEAMDFVHSGELGEIRAVKAWAYMDWMKNIPRESTTTCGSARLRSGLSTITASTSTSVGTGTTPAA